jgi:hypothetical protein
LREQRLHPRRNTSIQAYVIYNGGRAQVPCTIRNLSDGGAKLEIATPVRDIPATFDLVVPGHRPRPCRVAWRALRELGVAFS